VTPGPFLIVEHADVFWGVIASMYIGNLMLIILNLPLVGIWVQLLRVPYSILAPVVILFTMIGSYSIANQAFDLYTLIAFGVLGYALRKLKFEAGPLPLAFILGPMIEGAMRQSLLMSGGSFAIFVTRPISLTIVALFALFVAGQIFVSVRRSSRCSRAQKTA
jgi:putative tricarboxylic transport membrane protein